MKITHAYTLFKFFVDEIEYTVICKSAKHGSNIFEIHKGQEYLSSLQPVGCHVNKTMAEKMLRKVIAINH